MSRIISINVGKVETINYHNREVKTAINKCPVQGAIEVKQKGLDSDEVADHKNHGGTHKAIYIYAWEDYEYWEAQGLKDIKPGLFGENLTTIGFRGRSAYIGDHFVVNNVRLAVTQPRIPCYKLSARVGHEDFGKRFIESGRFGVYLKVLAPGVIETGDAICKVKLDPEKISMDTIAKLYFKQSEDYDTMQRLVNHKHIPDDLRKTFHKRLMESNRLL